MKFYRQIVTRISTAFFCVVVTAVALLNPLWAYDMMSKFCKIVDDKVLELTQNRKEVR